MQRRAEDLHAVAWAQSELRVTAVQVGAALLGLFRHAAEICNHDHLLLLSGFAKAQSRSLCRQLEGTLRPVAGKCPQLGVLTAVARGLDV